MPRGCKLSSEVRAEIERLLLIGKSGNAVAREIGLSGSAVSGVRKSLGIPAYPVTAHYFEPTEDQLAELLRLSDREMHRRYGVDTSTWSKVRVRHGIDRFREPTVGKSATVKTSVPSPWKAGRPHQTAFSRPARDHSLFGEAADFLRTERWVVINRAKVYGDDGWNVGRMRLTATELVEMAVRKGFVIRDWMGAAA